MSLRQIRVLGDPVLRKKARKVTRFGDDLAALVDDMVETMREFNGVGLAAPQVGVLERLVVIETPDDEDEPGSGQLYAVINPEIVRSSKEMVDGLEGCLSIPGYVGEVTRHAAVTIQGKDLKGRKTRIKAQGFLARVFQHEIDHLSGELFIDKLTAPEHIWRVDEGEEEQAEAQKSTAELVPAKLPLEWTQA
jgi:peptide deformylase